MRTSFSSRATGILSIMLVTLVAGACGGGGSPSSTNTPVANSVVATVNPAGPVHVQVGASQAASIVFTSSDGNPVTDLSITTGVSPLPAGWTSSNPSLACASVATGDGCQLHLNYAPSAATPASTLTIGYRYIDRAGGTQMASVSLAYAATPPALKKMAYITKHDSGNDSIIRCEVKADGSLADCRDAGATGLASPMSLATADSYAYIVNNANNTITRCAIETDGAMSNCQDAGASMLSTPYAIAIWGMTAYVSNLGNDKITQCTLDAARMLSDCKNSGAHGLSGPSSIAFKGVGAYIANSGDNNVSYCLLASDNGLSDCVDSGVPLLDVPRTIAINGSTAYIVNDTAVGIIQCTIDDVGTLSACKDSGATLLHGPYAIAVNGSTAYIVNWNGENVIQCTIESDGALAHCKDSGVTSLKGAAGTGIQIHTIDSDSYGGPVIGDEFMLR